MATPEPLSPDEAALVLEPIPPALLDEPLDYIVADHFRQRRLCAALKRFADAGRVPAAEAAAVASFLARDIELHHQDEDEDLFPALRRRMTPEDGLGSALDQLQRDHVAAAPRARLIAQSLAKLRGGEIVLDAAVRDCMRAYAAGQHRHLAIENGIVLAIARIRLTRGDLKAMSAAMKQRREAQP